MRRAFSNTLMKLAKEDPKVIFLTGDLGFGVFDEFMDLFPSRYVNTGVAESQLINTAAGLALDGWKPIAYSIGPFATCRPFEQIKLNVSYHDLPVLIVGAGGGFTYADAGVTHHSQEDVALMSLLPNMTIVTPGGPDELEVLMPQIIELGAPAYMRVGKFGEPNVDHTSPITLGKARKLLIGDKTAVISVGDIVSEILPAIKKYNSTYKPVTLYHIHTIKPIEKKLLNQIGEDFDNALIIEETIPQGGIYNEFCRWRAETNSPLNILRRGAPDAFIYGSPNRDELRKRIRVDAVSVIETLKKIELRY